MTTLWTIEQYHFVCKPLADRSVNQITTLYIHTEQKKASQSALSCQEFFLPGEARGHVIKENSLREGIRKEPERGTRLEIYLLFIMCMGGKKRVDIGQFTRNFASDAIDTMYSYSYRFLSPLPSSWVAFVSRNRCMQGNRVAGSAAEERWTSAPQTAGAAEGASEQILRCHQRGGLSKHSHTHTCCCCFWFSDRWLWTSSPGFATTRIFKREHLRLGCEYGASFTTLRLKKQTFGVRAVIRPTRLAEMKPASFSLQLAKRSYTGKSS